jgi:amidase
VQHATENMFYFLKDRLEQSEGEIAMLMSLVGQLQFCQVVDPLKTVSFIIPKQYTGELKL